MRRATLLLGALLLSSRSASAQFRTVPSTAFIRPPAQTAVQPGVTPNLLSQTQPQSVTASATPLEAEEKLTSFDGVHAALIWQNQSWKLMYNGVVIKDFGRREADARQAQRLARDLKLTQHGTIGETPVMEYWLSEGHAPTGLTSGLRTLAIDPTSLKAEQSQGQWVVRDRQRVWINFGLRGDEAQQALAVMQKYAFTQVGTIGGAMPTMMVFLGNPVRPGSGAATFRPPQTPPPDAVAALGGYTQPTLPPLHNAAAQPNQPTIAFSHGPVESLSSPQTSFLRGAPPAAPGLSERMPFDWRQTQVRQEQGHFKLAVGSHILGDFGSNERAAAQALKTVQYYRFTEHCQVGQPSSNCSYFLVGGQAPRGIPFGVVGQPIDAAHLKVEQVGDKYALVSGGQSVMQFGQRPDEAQHMLDVIQRHKFDHVCHLGGPEEQGMTFLVQAH